MYRKKCVSGSRPHTEVNDTLEYENEVYKDSKIFTMNVNGGS